MRQPSGHQFCCSWYTMMYSVLHLLICPYLAGAHSCCTQTYRFGVFFVSTYVTLPLLAYLHCGGLPFAGLSPALWLICGRPHGHAPSLPHPVGLSQGVQWKTPHYQSGSGLPGKRELKMNVPLLLESTILPLEPVIMECLINWKI